MHRDPFVLAFVGVLAASGCSVVENTVVATADPATPAAIAAAPIDAPEHHVMRFGVSNEHSCSMSWETTSEWGSYELTLTPPHGVRLVYESNDETRFGEAGKLSSGTLYDRHADWRAYEGTVGRVGSELHLELHPSTSECASKPCAPLSLVCVSAKVDVVSYDDAGKHVRSIDALRCTPAFGLPDDVREEGWGGGLVFGKDQDLSLHLERIGFDTFGPELEPSP